MPIVPPTKEKTEALTDSPELHAHGSLLRLLLAKFVEIGYRVDCYVVNSVNYGAPQIRERIICIGNRHGLIADFPAPQYSNRLEDGLPLFATLDDAIGANFIDPFPEVLDFSPRKLRYLAMVPQGGNWRSLPLDIQKESMGKSWFLKGGRSAYWRKLSFAFPSPTVVTMPNHAGTKYSHIMVAAFEPMTERIIEGSRLWRVKKSFAATRRSAIVVKSSQWVTSRRKCRQSISIGLSHGL